MGRAKQTSEDSLELLLDTICNMFGGIVLIAILLAVLSQTTSVTNVEVSSHRVVTEEEAERQAKELARLTEERTSLWASIASVPEPSTANAWRGEVEKLRKDINELTLQKESLTRTNQVVEREISVTEHLIRVKAAELAEVEKEVRKFRLPKATPTATRPVFLCVKGNALYAISNVSAPTPPDGRRMHDNAYVQVADQGGVITIEPRPGRGLAVAAGFEHSPLVTAIVRNVDKNSETLQFAVYDDSFDAFRKVKDFLVEKGFGYSWKPLPQSAGIRIVRVADARADRM